MDEQAFKARGFGQTIGFGRRSALVVIDVIKGFTNPDLPLGADLSSQIVAINALIADFAARREPVFFTTVRYDEPDLSDAGIWPLKQGGLKTLAASGDGAELDPRLSLAAGERTLVKKYASSFFGTDLSSRLVAEGVDTLVITGCTTSGCVRATAVDSLQNGFRPIVVREAVGDRSQPAHEQSLLDLQAKYADVVSLDAALMREMAGA
ncbi:MULTISPECIES: isochorismatase family protein [Alphaproteobacteria]|jgi:maleamate amidohydrolase|uniref:Maleamate amidohydrolase n=4 Tax=Alphaproteobacteria TaxID=28211 RepID=A0A1U9Z9S1_9HYPH|nr:MULTISPECIES: isochorismatase family protein [Alphaproteobacteria]KAA2311638.1 isochorismatase family protein [Puniceibacterium sp. HSS470]MAQ42856.1 carbamoylsarcosine amidase [Mesonia sp.]MBR9840139.1 isochorismatase family protein [Paracoccaceae bacterium]NDW59337.1 isochorismatase family protein [Salipiger sp. PrR004]QEW23881.1 Maleamate amidohydrolase [Marinibacterium anthonyi]|tara:strand:- start:19943 stop:20566 length:624 start_codon:yes stop_codon:yes gene_type:complete